MAEIVEDCDGVPLYAGGDDVLALLTCDRALECADRLRTAYGEAFGNSTYTASVAIVFAHFHLPLREVMAEAHRQLDDIAKDRNGRDSIALSWLKASGKAAEWVACWRDAQGDVPIEHFRELTAGVQKDDFGTGFFYKLTARYPWLGNSTEHPVSPAHIERLLQAEYLKTRERSASLNDAENAVRILLAASRKSRREENGAFVFDSGLQLDALRLARLLAGKEART